MLLDVATGYRLFEAVRTNEVIEDDSCNRPTGGRCFNDGPDRPCRPSSVDSVPSGKNGVMEVGVAPVSVRLLRGFALIFPYEER